MELCLSLLFYAPSTTPTPPSFGHHNVPFHYRVHMSVPTILRCTFQDVLSLSLSVLKNLDHIEFKIYAKILDISRQSTFLSLKIYFSNPISISISLSLLIYIFQNVYSLYPKILRPIEFKIYPKILDISHQSTFLSLNILF